MTIAERFSGAKYNVASKLHRLKANTWDSDNKYVRYGTRGAAVVGGLSAVGVLAGCDLTVPTDKNDSGTTVIRVGGETPGTHNPELQISDPNTLLFLKAGIDYGSLDVSQKAVLTSYWNTALDQMQDITSLNNHTTDNILAYTQDGFKEDANTPGMISKYDIQHPSQFGKIITFKDGSGEIKELSCPFFTNTGVDFTKRNQFMIPGFYGGYVKVGDQYVFAELFPNTTKISKSQANLLKQNGTIEIEGNDKVGYYKVDGYRVSLFQVDGKHNVSVMADSVSGSGRGGAGGDNYTAGQFITGDNNSIAEMGNDRTGKLVVIIYGGDSDANIQLRKYAETGQNKPAFVLDSSTPITTSKDANGETTYNIEVSQSTLNNLPYIEGAFTK